MKLETNNAFRAVFKNNESLTVITDEQLIRLKDTLLQMMDDIHATCIKHNLQYTLCGGSCLGAVRHKGFIPWDDDMDIAMPRCDYNQLAAALREDYPGKYWIQSIEENSKVENNSMKVRLAGTRCVELFEPDPDTAGIFIDVYALEDTYDSSIRRKIHGYHGMALLFICSCVRMIRLRDKILPYVEDKSTKKAVKIKCVIGRCFSFRSLTSWVRRTEKVLQKCKNSKSEYISIPSGRKHYFGEMYHRKLCFPAQLVPFEDRQYMIVNEPNEHLTMLYGDDYMVIPSEKPERHAILELSWND